ncbi:MAG TPA: YetF domain-containing protein [Bryobacteraceae bacterium]|nr:YetF domain-containing protein [Bryobacteraceae bacterium]
MPSWVISHDMWSQIFALGAPLVEKMLRPIVVYVFLVAVLRVFGKRELAQLNPFDLVVLLSLSNTVQNAIIGNDNSLSGGLVGAFTLLAVNYFVVRYLFRHRRLDQLFEGRPVVLIDEGKVNKPALAKELLTRAELMTVLHRQGFGSMHDVERCVLEPGGSFSVLGKTPPTGEIRHGELLKRLEELSAKLDLLASQGGSGQ